MLFSLAFMCAETDNPAETNRQTPNPILRRWLGETKAAGEEKVNRDTPEIKMRVNYLKSKEKQFSNRDSHDFFFRVPFAHAAPGRGKRRAVRLAKRAYRDGNNGELTSSRGNCVLLGWPA
jgi:hypothetical protein